LRSLYPDFEFFSQRKDDKIEIIPTLGHFINTAETGAKVKNIHMNFGDVLIPPASNNPGFDVIIKHNALFYRLEEGKYQPPTTSALILLLEMKFSNVMTLDSFGVTDMQKKYETLKKTYDVGGQFRFGKVVAPWDSVVYLFVSAHDKISHSTVDYSIHKFEGLSGVCKRETLAKMLGSPLNNCGVLLENVFRSRLSSTQP